MQGKFHGNIGFMSAFLERSSYHCPLLAAIFDYVCSLHPLPDFLCFRPSSLTLLVLASPHPCQPVAGEIPCALGRFGGYSNGSVVHVAFTCHQLTMSTACIAWLQSWKPDKQNLWSAFEIPCCLMCRGDVCLACSDCLFTRSPAECNMRAAKCH